MNTSKFLHMGRCAKSAYTAKVVRQLPTGPYIVSVQQNTVCKLELILTSVQRYRNSDIPPCQSSTANLIEGCLSLRKDGRTDGRTSKHWDRRCCAPVDNYSAQANIVKCSTPSSARPCQQRDLNVRNID